MDGVNTVLSHYGIPGMKWGHRKGQDSSENRSVKKTDLEGVMNLFNNLSGKDKKYLALDQKLTLIKNNIRNERHCSVVTDKGKVIGFLRESGRPKGFVLLEELVVDPKYRGQGVASKMLDDFHAANPKTLAKTKADNEDMKRLLMKKGYKADNPSSKTVINWVRNTDKSKKAKEAVKEVIDDMLGEEIQHSGGDYMNEVNDILVHFGIPGMKWHNRRGRATSSSHKKPPKPDTRSSDHIKKRELQRKKISEMSNDDLKSLNTRLQLEKQYRDLTKQDLSPGKKFVYDLLVDSGKQTAKNYTSKAMTKGVEAAIKMAV